MTSVQWTKQGTAEVGDLGNLRIVEIELEFQQTQAKGLAALRNRFQPVDPDLVAVAYAGRMPVDAADPKNRQSILNGAATSLGDRRGSGAETIVLRLEDIRREDADITAFGLFAVCEGGFNRVEGAVARIYDGTGDARAHIANVRFDLTSSQSSALLGIIKKTGTGWEFRKDPVYGRETNWRDFASMATSRLG